MTAERDGVFAARFGKLIRRILAAANELDHLEMARLVLPAVVLENDRVEWSYARDEFIGECRLAASAVAGKLSGLAIENPAGSGLLLTLQGCELINDNGAGNNVKFAFYQDIDITTYPAANKAGIRSRDSRVNSLFGLATSISPINTYHTGTTGIASHTGKSATRAVLLPAQTSREVTLNYVLSPGHTLGWETLSVNQALEVCWTFRYRVAVQPYELDPNGGLP